MSVTSHITSHISFATFLTASSGRPDRISRTRPSFEEIRWNQAQDSTTVSGFSNLSRQPPAELGKLALPTAPESGSEMGREESEEREKGDNSLRRFRKMKRERRPIPAGMLNAILRQRSEDKIAVADERDISKPASRHKLNPA